MGRIGPHRVGRNGSHGVGRNGSHGVGRKGHTGWGGMGHTGWKREWARPKSGANGTHLVRAAARRVTAAVPPPARTPTPAPTRSAAPVAHNSVTAADGRLATAAARLG